MRICYVADGRSIHTQRWVNYLARRGHDVHLICWEFAPGYLENVHIHKLGKKLSPRIGGLLQYFGFLLWMIQVRWLVRKIKPDIVDGHFVTVYGFLAAICGFHPLVVTAWGSDILVQPDQNALFKFTAGYAVKKADLVVCRSEIMKGKIVELGAEPNKVRICILGVDTKKFHTTRKDVNLKSDLGIDQPSPVVISTRSLRPVYDIETLIKAAPLVLAELPKTKFIIASYAGEQQEYLGSLVQSLDITNCIKFTGRVSHTDLPRYLASFEIYVSTSLSDGTPNSLLEAMACGAAPVVTSIPANLPWIKDGENGFLFPPKDYETLAARIIELIKDENKRETFSNINTQIIQSSAQQATEMAKLEAAYIETVGV